LKPVVDKELLSQCRLVDAAKIRRHLRRLKHISSLEQKQQVIQELQDFAKHSAEQVRLKLHESLSIVYPESLPVAAQSDRIKQAISSHQVVVIAGDTGSGKTTQLPKMCLELGYGAKGLIGHTQPRRLAARTVATRIADEVQQPLGDSIGYQVRFSEKTSPNTRVKLMTDGILLAQLPQDKLLLQYEVLIIDEAHERSLNIDFILGYLKQVLPKRPDLKVIITSATIDVDRFSQHFGQAPVIQVSGRTFPVETRYRPLITEQYQHDMVEGIDKAVHELLDEGQGDILIFLNGEREIRDVSEYLAQQRSLQDIAILPLYSRLSFAEQSKVFSSSSKRRIVLSTNVAETSLTVPNIHYVIDTGTARISRYSYRSKVQRLPIEPIARASADQRKGRCGRVAEGICIRLYSEEDFLARPEFTDPEMLRTNLASVILQMHHLKLGSIEDFPFVDPPDKRYIRDGFTLLEELNAVSGQGSNLKLTQIGRELSRLPIDPRLARMVLAAREKGCLHEVMVIVCGLSIQDPRERPASAQQASDEKHARFKDKSSDFLSLLNLWRYVETSQQQESRSQFRRRCKKEFLAYLRIREWQDLYTQLKQSVKDLGAQINTQEAPADLIHQALLSGLLSHIGMKDPEGYFIAARSRKFFVFPGSGLAKKPPAWLMAAQLVETSRLFARECAQIDPAWIESWAQHLVKKDYSDPRFDTKTSSVIAFETQRLYGLPVVHRRKCQFGAIDPKQAREIFIRQALVEGLWRCKASFFKHNQALLEDVYTLENKSRRRDLVVDEERLFDFYNQRLPEAMYNAQLFLGWWQKQKQKAPDYLNFTEQDILAQDTQHISKYDFPDHFVYQKLKLPLTYQFEPQQEDDGVSVRLPVGVLNQIEPQPFEWLVPGMLQEKLVAWIKALPKVKRKRFVPAPQYAQACFESLPFGEGDLLSLFCKHLQRMTGEPVVKEDFLDVELPEHLKMNYQIMNAQGHMIAQGRDLSLLQGQLQNQVEQVMVDLADDTMQHSGLTTWSCGDIAAEYEKKQAGLYLKAYPALVDDKDSVAVKLFDDQLDAIRAHQQGLRRLLLLNMTSPIRHLERNLSNKAKLALYFNPMGQIQQLLDDLMAASIDDILAQRGEEIRSEAAFAQAQEQVRSDLFEKTEAVALEVEKILVLHQALRKRFKGRVQLDWAFALSDMQQQLDQLVFKGFVTKMGVHRLKDIYRYLQAMEKRLEKLSIDIHRDRAHCVKVQHVEKLYRAKLNQISRHDTPSDACLDIRWMIEELRVSFFAQSLGTRYPISVQRIEQAIKTLD